MVSEASDPVVGKVVIDFSKKYVSIYLCEGDGTIKDYDHFRYPCRLEMKEARRETQDCYHWLYDWANRSVNFESASDGQPPPTV